MSNWLLKFLILGREWETEIEKSKIRSKQLNILDKDNDNTEKIVKKKRIRNIDSYVLLISY